MGTRVVVLGGGVGGLSVAQELAERGFQVEVYERRPVFGGKARSIQVPGSASQGRTPLPGEHGFRFFPSFYKHLPDTMKRIPFAAKSVFDNLVYATRVQIARVGKLAILEPTRFPQTLDDWLAVFKSLFSDLGIPENEVGFFVDRLLVLLTTCPERRLAEYENLAWWDFIDARNKSVSYQKYLGEGLTRSLVAMKAEISSTRTVGYINLQLILGLLCSGEGFDRLLNGPTNDVWIDPWIAHLNALGVKLLGNSAVHSLELEGGRLARVVIERGGQIAEVTAEWFVSALPVEIMAGLITENIKTAAPSLARLDKLPTRWMNGIQFYLRDDVPLVHGHSNYLDSPWALTSVSQRQFWPEIDFSRLGDGSVGGILSVVVSDWDAPGILYGKPATECTAQEIRNEVWAQLKVHLNNGGREQINDSNLLSWFLDPDIQFPNPTEVTNVEPLLINPAGSLQYRPEASTEIPNLFLASDYVRTYTDLATMEAANEAARRSVNALIDASGSKATKAQLWPLQEPEFFKPMQDYDLLRFKLGLPHGKVI
ncbi:MAG: FAD-dependent oxidoreductase [Acidobacteriia bacterium]|nr:FAD-dependent oxidoreductase [Terriglobia bacterium]